MVLTSALIGLGAKAIGGAVGASQGKKQADEQMQLERDNYAMDMENQQKQRDYMDQQHSEKMMSTFDPMGQSQQYWAQMGGQIPSFRQGERSPYPYQGQPMSMIQPTLFYNRKNFQQGGQIQQRDSIDTSGYAERIRNLRGRNVRKNEDGTFSTVLMGQMDNFAYPTLFQDDDGEWFQLPHPEAFEEAKKRGELFETNSEREARDLAEGSWKPNVQYPGPNLGDPYESTDEFPHGSNVEEKGKKKKKEKAVPVSLQKGGITPAADYSDLGYQKGGNIPPSMQGMDPATMAAVLNEFQNSVDNPESAEQRALDQPLATGEVEFDALTQLSLGALPGGAFGKAAPAIFGAPTRTIGQRAVNVAAEIVNPLHTKNPKGAVPTSKFLKKIEADNAASMKRLDAKQAAIKKKLNANADKALHQKSKNLAQEGKRKSDFDDKMNEITKETDAFREKIKDMTPSQVDDAFRKRVGKTKTEWADFKARATAKELADSELDRSLGYPGGLEKNIGTEAPLVRGRSTAKNAITDLSIDERRALGYKMEMQQHAPYINNEGLLDYLGQSGNRSNQMGGYMGTRRYQNGGRTLLEMVQAGNPQAYWPSANVGNYNNPGNVRRHRKNRDLRYPGSSQNFQGGGNLYAQNGMQGEVVPQEASFMSNLGGAVNQYGKNLVDPEVWKSFVDPSFWAKVPQALGDLGGEIMGGDPVGDRVTGQYNEQKQRERTKAVPNQYQQGGNLLQMVQAGNPNAYWPSANVGNYNNPGNVGRHRDNMDQRYPGSSQNFQGGGNMYDELQNIGYEDFATYQMGGGLPAGAGGVEGGNMVPISDNSVEVQGNNPNEIDGVDTGNAMVDNGEMIKDLPNEPGQRVFSDTLKLPGSSKTVAEEAKKLEKQKHPDKPEQNALIEQKLDELFQMQQIMNGDSHGEGPEEAAAGGMDPQAAQNAGKPIAQMGLRGRDVLGHMESGIGIKAKPLEFAPLPNIPRKDEPAPNNGMLDNVTVTGTRPPRGGLGISDAAPLGSAPTLPDPDRIYEDTYQKSMEGQSKRSKEAALKANAANTALLDTNQHFPEVTDIMVDAMLKGEEIEANAIDDASKALEEDVDTSKIIVKDYDKNWDYKMDGDNIYTRRKTPKGKTDGKWINVSTTKAGKAIYNDVFLGKPSAYGAPPVERAVRENLMGDALPPGQSSIVGTDKETPKTGAIAEKLEAIGLTADDFYAMSSRDRQRISKEFFGRRTGLSDIDRLSTPGSVTLEDINDAGLTIDDYFNMKRKDRNAFEIDKFGRKLTNKDRRALAKDSKLVGEDMLSGSENPQFTPEAEGDLAGMQNGGYTNMAQASEMQMQVPYPEGRKKEPAYSKPLQYQAGGFLGMVADPEMGLGDAISSGVSGAASGYGAGYTTAYGKGTDQPELAAMGAMSGLQGVGGAIGQDQRQSQSYYDNINANQGNYVDGWKSEEQGKVQGMQMGGNIYNEYAGGGYAPSYAGGGYGGGFDYRHVGGPDNYNLPMSMLAIARRFPSVPNADLNYLQRQAGGSWGNFDNEHSKRRETEDIGRNKRDFNDETPNVNLRSREGYKLAVPSIKKMHESRGNTKKKSKPRKVGGLGYQMGGWLMPSISLYKKSLSLAIKTGV